MFSEVPEFSLYYCSLTGGIIHSFHQVPVMKTVLFDNSVLFIPGGGMGSRRLLNDKAFIHLLTQIIPQVSYCLTVCTGSALVAKTGLLDAKKVTSNKKAWSWVISMNNEVDWQHCTRWCVENAFYTSSGVSAGIDMAIGFVADLYGKQRAILIANLMEYVWNDNDDHDLFCKP